MTTPGQSERPDQSDSLSKLSAEETRELALVYIDRRLAEEDSEQKMADWLSGERGLPAVWPRYRTTAGETPLQPAQYHRRWLAASCEANQEFLHFLREQVEDGNLAWIDQLAEKQLRAEAA